MSPHQNTARQLRNEREAMNQINECCNHDYREGRDCPLRQEAASDRIPTLLIAAILVATLAVVIICAPSWDLAPLKEMLKWMN